MDFKNFSVYWDTELLGSVDGARLVVSAQGGGVKVETEVLKWLPWIIPPTPIGHVTDIISI